MIKPNSVPVYSGTEQRYIMMPGGVRFFGLLIGFKEMIDRRDCPGKLRGREFWTNGNHSMDFARRMHAMAGGRPRMRSARGRE